jgi:N-acetylmuramoyl-L-alanine amidase
MDRRVILAAGHGGDDNGAVARGRKEAAKRVDIVNRTAAKLQTDGRIQTVVVPHAFNLREQIAWLNARFPQHESGYAVEVHKNAAGSLATGVEAWYLTGSAEAGNKANSVLGELARVSRLQNRGIKKDVDYRGGSLAWVRQTKPWAGLFECGFITHDHFNNDLYAEGLFRGLLKLFGLRDQAAQIYRASGVMGRRSARFAFAPTLGARTSALWATPSSSTAKQQT